MSVARTSAESAARSEPSRDARERPLRDLRISVTDRCNFRCGYCMPAEIFGESYSFLPRREILSFEEIERLTRIMVGLGVRKVRITGGEPLLRHDLADLIARLRAVAGIEDIGLTTNATLLKRMAGTLRRAGLGRMTVSLDSLDEAVFRRMNGGKLTVGAVLEGIETAQAVGFGALKLNCVVQKGVNDHTLVALARHFKGSGHIVRFIEFMDVGTKNGWDVTQVLPASEIVARIDAELPIQPIDPNYAGEVAKRWRYRDGDGEIGIITSVSEPFCSGCTRARLTTDGRLVTCLFASGGTDLRAPLRDGASDEELTELIRGIWQRRSDQYSEERTAIMRGEQPDGAEQDTTRRVEMYEIGG